jgi:predicted amidohydrolase YtcJ
MIDHILHNANLITMDSSNPSTTSLAIKNDTIVAVGDDDAILNLRTSTTRVTDLNGLTVLPGLADSHCHMRWLGQSQRGVDLSKANSYEELVAIVRREAQHQDESEWIIGWGWNQERWSSSKLPSHHILSEAVPNHPVWLVRVDTHAGLANDMALREAGITRLTQPPAGGAILLESAEPTGVLIDKAMSFIEKLLPKPSVSEICSLLLAAQDNCLALGLTQIHDPGIDEVTIEAYRTLATEGKLKLRVHAMLRQEHMSLKTLVPISEERFTLRCIKVLLDGALGSYGAALEAAYRDNPREYGLLLLGKAELLDSLHRAFAAGFQASIHAIGDRANHLALDVVETVLGDLAPFDHRTRIEHAQVLRPEDIPRFANLGIIASVQPAQCPSDIAMSDSRLGSDRAAHAHAWRALLDTGIVVTSGSDTPVESLNPFWGMYAAVTRADHQGIPTKGWHPEQAMSLQEALQSYTTGPAYASFQEAKRGKIKPGWWADLTIVDQDIINNEISTLLQTSIKGTMIAGEIVYGSLGNDTLGD